MPPWIAGLPNTAPRPQTQRIVCIEPPPPAIVQDATVTRPVNCSEGLPLPVIVNFGR
jgi:hypothetical protein